MANARLIIRIQGIPGKQVHELTDDVTTIGRSSENVLQIKDSKSSRKHCRIERVKGAYKLQDLGSSNGTEVNGSRIAEQTLKRGDKIRIGKVTFEFEHEVSGAAPIADPAVQAEAGQPKYVLAVTEGAQSGECFDLGTEPFTIGRHSSNNFKIDDDSASTYHAEVTREPMGYVISDLGSTNGTRVNEEKIVKHQLTVGSVIRIGKTKIAFKNVGAPAEDDELFGTIVLDEDQVNDAIGAAGPGVGTAIGKAGIFVGAAALVLAAFALVIFMIMAWRGGKVQGDNRVKNSSFADGTDPKGNPSNWSTTRGRNAQWEVTRDEDADPSKVGGAKAALLLRRGGSDPALAIRCRYRSELPVKIERGYHIGGRIKGIRANGEYGLQLEWLGKSGRGEIERFVLSGVHNDWEKISEDVLPPRWATSVRVACVSEGHQGEIYWDDVEFYALATYRNIPNPRPEDQAAGALKLSFRRSGVLDFRHGSESAIAQVELYLKGKSLGGRLIERTQELAGRESDASEEGSAYVFKGDLLDLSSGERLIFDESVSVENDSVRVIYDLSAEDGSAVEIEEIGVRLVIQDAFNRAPRFTPDSFAPAPDTLAEQVQEIAFSRKRDKDKGQVVVFLGDQGRAVRYRKQGSTTIVEVVFRRGGFVSDQPRSYTVEFASSSPLKRRAFDKDYHAYAKTIDVRDLYGLGEEIVRKYENEFPDEIEKIKRRLADLDKLAAADLKDVHTRIGDMHKASGDASRKSARDAAERALARFTQKWAGTRHESGDGDARSRIDRIVQDWTRASIEAEATTLLRQGRDMYRRGIYSIAGSYFRKLRDDPKFEDTRAKEELLRDGLIQDLEKKQKNKEDLQSFLRRIRGLQQFFQGEPARALEQIQNDPDFGRFRINEELIQILRELKRAIAAKQ